MRRLDGYEWAKTRVWWTAKHRFNGTIHLAATVQGGTRKLTRCGVMISGKRFKVYEIERVQLPAYPTCGRCLRLRQWDLDTLTSKEAAATHGTFYAYYRYKCKCDLCRKAAREHYLQYGQPGHGGKR